MFAFSPVIDILYHISSVLSTPQNGGIQPPGRLDRPLSPCYHVRMALSIVQIRDAIGQAGDVSISDTALQRIINASQAEVDRIAPQPESGALAYQDVLDDALVQLVILRVGFDALRSMRDGSYSQSRVNYEDEKIRILCDIQMFVETPVAGHGSVPETTVSPSTPTTPTTPSVPETPLEPSDPVLPDLTTLYFGTSADSAPSSDELTIQGVDGVGTIPPYNGEMYLLIARLFTESPITSVTFSDDSTNTNQVEAFARFGSEIIPEGETGEYVVWVSNQALTQPAELIVTVE